MHLAGGYVKKQNLVESFLIRQLMRGRKCVHVEYLIIYLIVITFVSSITPWRSSFWVTVVLPRPWSLHTMHTSFSCIVIPNLGLIQWCLLNILEKYRLGPEYFWLLTRGVCMNRGPLPLLNKDPTCSIAASAEQSYYIWIPSTVMFTSLCLYYFEYNNKQLIYNQLFNQ